MEPVSTVMAPPPPTGKVAFQQGLIFGLVQAVIASSVLFINAFVFNGQVGPALLLSLLSFFTGLAAYFVAGILAAQKNGKVKTGTFAGMWTGGIYGIIGLVVSLVIFVQVTYPRLVDAAISSRLYSSNIEAYKTGAMIGGVGAAIFGFLAAIGIGAGLGALGGLIGRNTSRYKPVPAVQVIYAPMPGQSAPYPGQPMLYGPPAGAEQVYPEQQVPNPYAANPYEQPPQQQ